MNYEKIGVVKLARGKFKVKFQLSNPYNLFHKDISVDYKSLRIFLILNYICAIYLVVYIVSPILKVSDIFLYILICSMSLWLLTALCLSPSFFILFFKNYIITAIYLVSFYIIIASIITYNFMLIKRFFGLFVLLFIQIMYLFYCKKFESHIIKLSKIVLILLPIFSAISIYYGMSHTYLLRRVLTSGSQYNQYLAFGVGGYDFVYSYVILIPACIYVIKYKKRIPIFWRFVCLANTIIGSWLVLISGFTIALLILILSLIIICLVNKIDIKVIIFLLLIGILTYFYLIYLQEIIFKLAENTLYAERLEELFLFAHYRDYAYFGPLYARFYHYNISFNALMNNFILGTVYSVKVVFGNHSTILDISAVYGGIIGFLLIYILFATPLSLIKKYRNINFNSLILVTVFSMAIILTFNNDIPLLGLMVYFVLHTILHRFKSSKMSKGLQFQKI